LIGALALIGFPGSSGFFSKDALIEAVHGSHRVGAEYAYFCVVAGVFVTALYTFRMFFMTFHGEERMDHHTRDHLHESPWTITVPLVLLAIPSALAGWFTIKPMLFGDFFAGAIQVLPAHDVLGPVGEEFGDQLAFIGHAFLQPPLWLAAAGVFTAYWFFLKRPELADAAERKFGLLHRILVEKYGFDWFNEHVLAAGARMLGRGLWRYGDEIVIDGGAVNGSARVVRWFSSVIRYAQSGYLYHYAFGMFLGLASLLLWLLWRT